MIDEQAFREHLDADGILRPGALEPPARAYAIFAQRRDATLALPALRAHALRFFDTKVGLTADKHYGIAPLVDAARIVVSTAGASGTRLAYGRPTTSSDLAAADAAEQAQRTSGMALLARRCPTIWLVERVADDDRVALTLAAILSSHLLGPIVAGDEIFGVRTARMKLERS